MQVEIVPFQDTHVEGAAELLAARQRRQRKAEPALAARLEDPAETRRELELLLGTEHASGSAALAGERLIGFLVGTRRGDLWGPNVWVEAAGHAVEEPELARDLYAAAAARWVEDGRTSHYAIVPASDTPLVDAWFRLSFGLQFAHALREVRRPPEAPAAAGSASVRPAERADIPALARLDRVLPLHQGRSPVFSSGGIPTLEEGIAEWESDWGEGGYATFVAEVDGAIVGSAVGCALELSSTHGGMAAVDGAALLGYAAVDPEARGRGAGTALLAAVEAWAAESGYTTIVTDWRVTNLLSSRMWPNRGFRPTFYRLHRAIA